ncbi:hypothetical protein PSTEL_16900 [Paenibacillus stellifer]|uniref:Uncharacterized protein n=1 Tax=Paenibacillus stellifer TaxID=169760 RepID=A0A089LWK5_9BACL|nr:hypothetical protein [Paenibacillus stellifer]AIQ64525.1 hypothetical protein PSTEL_16900 [Paenibacillus stellifer]
MRSTRSIDGFDMQWHNKTNFTMIRLDSASAVIAGSYFLNIEQTFAQLELHKVGVSVQPVSN